jgi:hypothetical protein
MEATMAACMATAPCSVLPVQFLLGFAVRKTVLSLIFIKWKMKKNKIIFVPDSNWFRKTIQY